MTISISATNPCHLYPMALELARSRALGCYYSGYPKWRLPGSGALKIHSHPARTIVVYGMLKCLPEWAQPERRSLYLWQDNAFDRWVGRALEPADWIHAMPGQCLKTFERARTLGIRTVLNHASGPVTDWIRILEPEYRRVGLDVRKVTPFDAAYFKRAEGEYALSDFHCVASTVVRDQLIAAGIQGERIWVAPYGADTSVFNRNGRRRPSKFSIVFAGQVGLRKGTRILLRALELAGNRDWQVDFAGVVLPEARTDLDGYRGSIPLQFHGPMGQARLAELFRRSSVMVLPSLEEGFGLVVPQALNCGLPCVVSDRVGAQDLIKNRANGSIVATDDPKALLAELLWWEQSVVEPDVVHDWTGPAGRLLALTRAASS